jgi:hypothetical protein
MSTSIIVIDTSYLLELFAVPEFCDVTSVAEVKRRFEMAVEEKAILYVPLPCLFELANHVADIRDGNRRKSLADFLVRTVESCASEGIPWLVTPFDMNDTLPKLCRAFAGDYVSRGIGLTDTFTILEALRLKKKYNGPQYRVHIWTKDRHLKACEPDTEPEAFLGGISSP